MAAIWCTSDGVDLYTSAKRESMSLTGVNQKLNLLFNTVTTHLLPFQRLAPKTSYTQETKLQFFILIPPSPWGLHCPAFLPKPSPVTLFVTETIAFLLLLFSYLSFGFLISKSVRVYMEMKFLRVLGAGMQLYVGWEWIITKIISKIMIKLWSIKPWIWIRSSR